MPGYSQPAPGYPQQAQGFPQQPGYPQQTPGYPQQMPGFPQPVPGYPQPVPAKAKGTGLKIALGVVGAIVVVCVLVVALIGSRSEPRAAKVGDCLAGQSAEALKVVKCDATDAQYKVVGKIDQMSESDWKASNDPCPNFDTAEKSYWEGKAGKTGYVLCLEPMQKK